MSNRVISLGVTLADFLAVEASNCAAGAKNHGQFVSCTAKVLNALKKAGVITDAEKSLLQSAAARSR
ncbi:MAG: hypothetical protein HY674_15425 [Chloroflexi bacterium]|nr:hypothetical protein [Chloroflexota bacterium]